MLTVRYWAGARAAAGAEQEQVVAAPLDEVLTALSAAHPGLERVLRACSFLLDGVQLHRDAPAPLPAGAVLDVLPPFAGG